MKINTKIALLCCVFDTKINQTTVLCCCFLFVGNHAGFLISKGRYGGHSMPNQRKKNMTPPDFLQIL